MRFQRRLLLACGILSALTIPGHTQAQTGQQPRTYRLEGQVRDLEVFAKVILAWDRAPVEVLKLELGPKAGTEALRPLSALLAFEDFQALHLSTQNIEGLTVTSVRAPVKLAAPAPLLRTSLRAAPELDPETESYPLRFEDLEFEPDTQPDTIAIPPLIRPLDGQIVSLEGYMIPLQYEGNAVTEYLLVRHLAACCFGGTPEPDEWVFVRAPEGAPAEYKAYQPIRVRGKLELPTLRPGKQDTDFDMAYRLLEAVVQ